MKFDSVGGLTAHIKSLKEMVVFPLLYPEVFEKFKIQPPRWDTENVFSCVSTCIKTDSLISSAHGIILNFLTNTLSCAAVGVACSTGLRGQGRLWWLGRWLTSAVRVKRRFPSLCERELTASANGWESQNDSSAFSLTRLTCSACFVLLGSKSQSNVIKRLRAWFWMRKIKQLY